MQRTISRILLPIVVIVILALAAPFSAQADEGDNGWVETVNGYKVTLMFAEHPEVGENQVHIQIRDALDMPVSNATVQVALAPVEEEHHEAAQEASSHENMSGMDTNTESSAHDGMAEMDMTAHESTAAHDEMQAFALEPAHESGEYSGKVHIESSGEWVISVHLIVQEEAMEVNFPLNIKTRSNLGILAGFAGVNVLILIAAAALKSKPVAQ